MENFLRAVLDGSLYDEEELEQRYRAVSYTHLDVYKRQILAFLLPGILLFGIIYAYPLVNIFMTSFCKWNYKNFLKPEFLGWSHLFDKMCIRDRFNRTVKI